MPVSFSPNSTDRENPENLPPPRRKALRDLTLAVTLRPREIYALYGIPESTLCGLFSHPDPTVRLRSKLVPGRCGRRGIRLVDHAELRKWLTRWEDVA